MLPDQNRNFCRNRYRKKCISLPGIESGSEIDVLQVAKGLEVEDYVKPLQVASEVGAAREDAIEVDLSDSFVRELILHAQVGKLAKKVTTKPGIIVEQKVDFSRWKSRGGDPWVFW